VRKTAAWTRRFGEWQFNGDEFSRTNKPLLAEAFWTNTTLDAQNAKF
jgi:hypothetical protein